MSPTNPPHRSAVASPPAAAASSLWQIAEAAMQAAADLCRRMAEGVQRRRRSRFASLGLGELDARTLRDIGLDRSEIESIAAEAAGGVDATRARSLQPLRGPIL